MKSILPITAAILALAAASTLEAAGRSSMYCGQRKHDDMPRQETPDRSERHDSDMDRHEHRHSEVRYRVEKVLLTIDGHGNWALVGEYDTEAEAEAAAAPLRATENVRITPVRHARSR